MRGLEPPAYGTTIRCSNQLSYIHRKLSYNPEAAERRDYME